MSLRTGRFDPAPAARARWRPAGPVTAVAVVAVALAVRAGRRVDRPLRLVAAVIDRLSAGEVGARAAVTSGTPAVREVARAVNTLAGKLARAKMAEAESARLNAAARRTGVRIRRHLTVESALDEAARGLAGMLAADYVLIRCDGAGADPAAVAWPRPAPAEVHEGWPDPPAERWSAGDLRTAGPAPLPTDQVTTLLALGAGPVVVIPFDAGPRLSGVAVLARDSAAGPWHGPEIEAAESVLGGLGRGLLQAQLYEREQELVERLQLLDETKTEFMWTVSHELRTPLASITGFVESLRDGDVGAVNDKQEQMLEVVERNGKRLQALIDDMLTLSRVEAGRLPTERQSTDVADLVQSAVAAIGPTAKRTGVAVESRIGGGLRAEVDADQIDRLVMNLLSNAVKFTPAEGHVTVTAVRDGDHLVLTVADTGIGVPDSDKAHLFTRFFRAGNAVSRVIPGTGLGLAIVQTIVANHGGVIDFDSAEGRGTTVTVRLPA
ncbi:sensor histidine kinase [Jidongwangia harbinensis]|uniref:sensor histidine kinase n=1 Tax=Jidongwangia harbinensis TaxID=2878561 RepID=UPI001CD9B920|nr:HAMP domain-containing sensor histidine kinase [Jidongwangia harbinensis]MCA2215036.1 HAMP domain-containing histidine kinase [Jidongwangia harbinensis]